jgi:hypothetical protein
MTSLQTATKHDPEKGKAVFGKDHAQNESDRNHMTQNRLPC